MKIVLMTESIYSAVRLKDKIINSISGNVPDIQIDTWSYVKAKDSYDIIYHNVPQYTEDPAKNVVFRVEINGENVYLSCAYWPHNPQPEHTIYCIHIGRLTEMLLTYFGKDILKYTIIDY